MTTSFYGFQYATTGRGNLSPANGMHKASALEHMRQREGPPPQVITEPSRPGQAGVTLNFDMEKLHSNQRGEALNRYMRCSTCVVYVWDADSHLQLGQVCLFVYISASSAFRYLTLTHLCLKSAS
jgi:hypothetical protein